MRELAIILLGIAAILNGLSILDIKDDIWEIKQELIEQQERK